MSLMDFIKKQFIDIIQWTEAGDGVLAHRVPMADMEIQYGASLTVRESQAALFVNEGKIADQFAPGRYKLTTQTLPVLTYLNNWDKLFESPFKSDVYFFSTRLQLDRKWGTQNPITLRDAEFGMVRLRAFGIYSYRLADPSVFHREVSGTRETYTVDELDGQLRNSVVSAISQAFAESGVPFVDMAANHERMALAVRARIEPAFAKLGLALDSFVVQNVSLPEEIQKLLDARVGMNIVGDMNKFTQYQTATSIPVAAANEGGVAGVGAGLGAGLAMAQAMANAATPAARGGGGDSDAILAMIDKLHGLMEKGALSKDEFEAKKAELLKKLG